MCSNYQLQNAIGIACDDFDEIAAYSLTIAYILFMAVWMANDIGCGINQWLTDGNLKPEIQEKILQGAKDKLIEDHQKYWSSLGEQAGLRKLVHIVLLNGRLY